MLSKYITLIGGEFFHSTVHARLFDSHTPCTPWCHGYPVFVFIVVHVHCHSDGTCAFVILVVRVDTLCLLVFLLFSAFFCALFVFLFGLSQFSGEDDGVMITYKAGADDQTSVVRVFFADFLVCLIARMELVGLVETSV
jgi:hypothetical protein